MECNKDEALRAKEIAERKFNEKDYVGAKKFVLKALNLYPGLESLPQFSTTLDIYLSSQNRISNGEVDWYNVLGVSPWADEETVRKQYRKLALALHPDKNKSLGADGAFKLVSEAWSLLSDRDRRVAYNRKLNHRDPRQSKASNGFHSATSSVNPAAAKIPTSNKKQNTFSGAASNNNNNNNNPSSRSKPDTFWTICDSCKTQFEYLRVYQNHTLLCPNCQQAFHAVERAPPPNIMKPPNNNQSQSPHHHHHQKQQKSKVTSAASKSAFPGGVNLSFTPSKSPGVESFGGGYVNGAGGTNHSSSSMGAQAASTVQDWIRNHMSKRSGGVMPPEEDQLLKKRRANETYMNSSSSHDKPGGTAADVFQFKTSVETDRVHVRRELTSAEIRNILLGKARLAISEKLSEWSSREVKVSSSSAKKKSTVYNSVLNNDDKADSRKPSNSSDPGKDSANVVAEPVSINVPDPDFHNFDADRTEASFSDDQVWAAYDENDGMPRYYARIHKVMSLNPFKMKISWLNSKTSAEFGSLDWIGAGFLKTCGDFRSGKHEISETLNAFSHKLKWAKGPRGIIRILPAKGDVWALYRNWSPEWNGSTPDDLVHKYDMVEVVEDYEEERGMSVVPLAKVEGFKTVFSKESQAVRRIPKEEMFRFSHQVPHRLLTGEEGENAPKGCFDLDPAATPLELLQDE